MPCLEPALVNRRCRRAQSWVLGNDFFRIRVKKRLIRRRNPRGVAVLQHFTASPFLLPMPPARACLRQLLRVTVTVTRRYFRNPDLSG